MQDWYRQEKASPQVRESASPHLRESADITFDAESDVSELRRSSAEARCSSSRARVEVAAGLGNLLYAGSESLILFYAALAVLSLALAFRCGAVLRKYNCHAQF